jgi:hypothetical protein
MIHINQRNLRIPDVWITGAKTLTEALLLKNETDRDTFIDENRVLTWGAPKLVTALQGLVGKKCWYSEVEIKGADHNVDHFRPKGLVQEIDPDSFAKTGKKMEDGYWWLAFEWKNYRLSSQHANQRRIDEHTIGGKADFFPVEGLRATAKTEWDLIEENVLPLDPCSISDVALMWFDPDGKPGASNANASDAEKRRIRITIWLYHLDKHDIQESRAKQVVMIHNDIRDANTAFKLWDRSGRNNASLKNLFDNAVNRISAAIEARSEFSGAKRCVVRLAIVDNPWILEFNVI